MPVGTTKWTIWNYSLVAIALAGMLFSVSSILRNHGVFSQAETQESVTLPRPYFTQTQAKIETLLDGNALIVSVENNDVEAKDVVTQLLVFPESLDPTIEPLHMERIEAANPAGPHSPLSQFWMVKIKPDMRPAFVVFQIRYIGALNDKTYLQSFFLEFSGVPQDGIYIEQLLNATKDEKTRIESYMKERGIPSLHTER